MSSKRDTSKLKKWKILITNQSGCLLGTNHHIDTHPRVLLLVGFEQRRTRDTMSTSMFEHQTKIPTFRHRLSTISSTIDSTTQRVHGSGIYRGVVA